MGSAFWEMAEMLPALLFLLFLIALCSSALIYFFEPRHNIASFPQSLWFCIVTMSTVGYGDISPQTTPGSIVTSMLIILSGLYLAIPIGIVGRSFSVVWEDRHRLLLIQRLRDSVKRAGYTPSDVQHMFELLDVDGNGELDFEEFSAMIELLQLGVSETAIAQVFETFDDDGAGAIDAQEFLCALFPQRSLQNMFTPEVEHSYDAGAGVEKVFKRSGTNTELTEEERGPRLVSFHAHRADPQEGDITMIPEKTASGATEDEFVSKTPQEVPNRADVNDHEIEL